MHTYIYIYMCVYTMYICMCGCIWYMLNMYVHRYVQYTNYWEHEPHSHLVDVVELEVVVVVEEA